jgi:hypothetical protein
MSGQIRFAEFINGWNWKGCALGILTARRFASRLGHPCARGSRCDGGSPPPLTGRIRGVGRRRGRLLPRRWHLVGEFRCRGHGAESTE